MYLPAEQLPRKREMERDFFRSLNYLEEHYALPLSDHRKLPYPYNILRTTHELGTALRRFGRNRELQIVKEETGEATISVCEQFRDHYDLNYIPVLPLYRLWQIPEQIKTAELLTAVFAFLYVEAGICYYRDEDVYMHYNYEILSEWVEESDEREEREVQLRCLKDAETAGEYMQQKMMDKSKRNRLPELIAAFQPQTAYEQKGLKIALLANEIAQAYPDTSLYQYAGELIVDDEDYGNDTAICMHEYIGFVSSNTDALSDDLYQMIENDFNERMYQQHPEIITLFNGAQPAYEDKLNYAEQLFKLIDQLSTLLSQQP